MKSDPKVKAFRSRIASEIVAILTRTAEEYRVNGEAKTDLRDAPEYLLCVDIARGLTQKFGGLRYDLEHRAKSFEGSSKQPIHMSDATGKALARFDVVLIDRKLEVPRFIIEVKLGHKIMGDARRVIGVAALRHGRPRWQHAFLVTILRHSEEEAHRIAEERRTEMESPETYPEVSLPESSRIQVKTLVAKVGESRDGGSISIYAAVFRLSLRTPDSADAQCGDDEIEL